MFALPIFIISILALSGVDVGGLDQVDKAWLLVIACLSGLSMITERRPRGRARRHE